MKHRRAILDVNLGVMVFILQDLVIKAVNHDYSIAQLLMVRCITAGLLLLIFLGYFPVVDTRMGGRPTTLLPALPRHGWRYYYQRWMRWLFAGLLRIIYIGDRTPIVKWRYPVLGAGAIVSPYWRLLLIRGVVMMMTYVSYYLAFPVMPLANVVAVFLTAPIFLAVFGFIMNRESILPYQWLAIIIGLVGSLLILRPMPDFFDYVFLRQSFDRQALLGDGFDIATLFPLLSALGYAWGQVASRKYLQKESPLVMSFYHTMGLLCFSVAVVVFFHFHVGDWHHPSMVFLTRPLVAFDGYDFWLILLTGPISVVGVIFLSSAYRQAPSAVIAPFEYIALLISFILGFLFWGETFDTMGVVGALLIVMAGMVVIKKSA